MKFLTSAIAIMFMSIVLLCAPCHTQEPSEDVTISVSPADLQGDNITLNIEEVNIRALLTLLAQARRVNIVAGPEVSGLVSVNLFDVPFRDALASILGVAGYTHYKKGAVIYVTTEEAKRNLPMSAHNLSIMSYKLQHADPAMVVELVETFLSPSGQVVINEIGAGSGEGQRSEALVVVQDAPEYLLQIDQLIPQLDVPPYEAMILEIEHIDIETLRPAIETLLSPSGSVEISTESKLVIQDAPGYVDRVSALVAELDVPPQQVLISTRILNILHDDNLSLGVRFGSSSIPFDPIRFDANLPFLTSSGRDLTSVTTGDQGVFSMILRDHEQLYIDALESRGNVETLAAPELLALEGEEASMIIGQKLGYKTNAQADNNTTFESVQFLEVGTQIRVTPKISRDGLIHMRIAPKVSDGEINALTGVPDENTTEVETTAVVRDGETILIGGLINLRKQRSRDGVPVLSKIPVFGLLFGRKRVIDSKSELVILITPHIVGSEGTPGMTAQGERIESLQGIMSSEEVDARDFFEPDEPQVLMPLDLAP